jgi:hypothetical protein
MVHERLLDLCLPTGICRTEEVEEVRVLEDLRRHVGVLGRQRPREVADGLAGATVRLVVNLKRQDIPALTVRGGLSGVPEARVGGVEFL